MNSEQWLDKSKKDRELAKDALIKMGYMKTTWGWIVKDRFTQLKTAGYVNIIEGQAGFTSKCAKTIGCDRVNAYLSGRIDHFDTSIL